MKGLFLKEVPIQNRPILSIDQMYAADQAAMALGVSGETLMENAGRAVVGAILKRWSPRSVAVLCGPGNNGGDGYVIARLLAERDWGVTVYALGDTNALKGDAKTMHAQYAGPVMSLDAFSGQKYGLVVDALFGAGLNKALSPSVMACLESCQQVPVVAVDVPSGLNGDTVQFMGQNTTVTWEANLTVSFHAPKPAHVLYPGRAACGDIVIADIGIPDIVLTDPKVMSKWRVNGPTYLRFLDHGPLSHKYSKGGIGVYGGDAFGHTAAQLVAESALRLGAGLVKICSGQKNPQRAPAALMWQPWSVWPDICENTKLKALVLGPGSGVGAELLAAMTLALKSGKACVLDADALTVLSQNFEVLEHRKSDARLVLTPHEGEFYRLFPDLREQGSKLDQAIAAARRVHSIIVFKGADTVIAAPDGTAWVNTTGSASLATAGSGDILAGAVSAFLAQGVPAFDAAALAVHWHGLAGEEAAKGMIADDLPAIMAGLMAACID